MINGYNHITIDISAYNVDTGVIPGDFKYLLLNDEPLVAKIVNFPEADTISATFNRIGSASDSDLAELNFYAEVGFRSGQQLVVASILLTVKVEDGSMSYMLRTSVV